MPPAVAASQNSPAQQNLNARKLVLTTGIDRIQAVPYNQTLTAGQTAQITLTNVGLNKRLWVKFTGTVTGVAGKTYTQTKLGLANFFSNVTLNDLDNNQRINTQGTHLHMVNSAKARFCYGAVINTAATDNPYGYGNNWTNVSQAPVSVAAAGAVNIQGFLEIPISYSDFDLRGAIFANLSNSTWSLSLTVNPNFCVSNVADPTFAVYQSADATIMALTNVKFTVYQNYLDNLPRSQQGSILPYGDLGFAYQFTWTQNGPLAAGQDNMQPYTNFRNYMSTLMIYDNAGTLTDGGADINYLSIRTANLVNIFQVDPTLPALWVRNRIKLDMPDGCYYFDHRKKPISTDANGNQAFVINPVTAGGTSFAYFGYEYLAQLQAVMNAGSLPST